MTRRPYAFRPAPKASPGPEAPGDKTIMGRTQFLWGAVVGGAAVALLPDLPDSVNRWADVGQRQVLIATWMIVATLVLISTLKVLEATGEK